MWSDQELKNKVNNIYKDLIFIKRLPKSKAIVKDIIYNKEFECSIKELLKGKVVFYKKQKSLHNLTFDEINNRLSKKLPHLTLLNFSKVNETAVFLDKDYGKFSATFKNVYNEKTCHIKRKKRISNNMSCDELNQRLQKKYKHLTIKVFNGIENTAVFLDKDYGEFEAKFYSVFHGRSVHKKRRKYNVKQSVNNKEYKNKKKTSVLKKYGVENVFQSEKIKNKIKETNLKKYGTKFSQQSIEIKNKTKETFVKRYGGYPSQNKKIKEKINNTFFKKYNGHPLQNKDIRKKINNTKINKGIIYNINGVCASEYYRNNNLQCSLSTFHKNIKTNNIKNAINFNLKKTNIENIIYNILNTNVCLLFNKQLYNTNIKPDFLIKDKNLIIECDGLYYHSDQPYNRKDIIENKNWHKERQELFKSLGYRSLFFREDEIINKTPIVESIILAKLGLIQDRIFARKTKIKEINSKTSSKFFEENHLMGKGKGKTFALIYEDQIVSAIRIINNKDHINISRFCNKLNTSVAGGLSKLLKHIIKEYNPQKIISFVDMRYGDGSSLEKLGFQEKTNYVSFKWTDFKQTFHRMNFRNNTGYESGLYKIWDCGQKKFEINLITEHHNLTF